MSGCLLAGISGADPAGAAQSAAPKVDAWRGDVTALTTAGTSRRHNVVSDNSNSYGLSAPSPALLRSSESSRSDSIYAAELNPVLQRRLYPRRGVETVLPPVREVAPTCTGAQFNDRLQRGHWICPARHQPPHSRERTSPTASGVATAPIVDRCPSDSGADINWIDLRPPHPADAADRAPGSQVAACLERQPEPVHPCGCGACTAVVVDCMNIVARWVATPTVERT